MRLPRLEVVLARLAKSCPVPSKPSASLLLRATVINKLPCNPPPPRLIRCSIAMRLQVCKRGYHRKGRRVGTFELIIWWCPVWIIQRCPRDEFRRPMCSSRASRGRPGKWDCLFDLSRAGNSLGNFESSRIHQGWKDRENSHRPLFTLRCFVRSRVESCVNRSRPSDGFC